MLSNTGESWTYCYNSVTNWDESSSERVMCYLRTDSDLQLEKNSCLMLVINKSKRQFKFVKEYTSFETKTITDDSLIDKIFDSIEYKKSDYVVSLVNLHRVKKATRTSFTPLFDEYNVEYNHNTNVTTSFNITDAIMEEAPKDKYFIGINTKFKTLTLVSIDTRNHLTLLNRSDILLLIEKIDYSKLPDAIKEIGLFKPTADKLYIMNPEKMFEPELQSAFNKVKTKIKGVVTLNEPIKCGKYDSFISVFTSENNKFIITLLTPEGHPKMYNNCITEHVVNSYLDMLNSDNHSDRVFIKRNNVVNFLIDNKFIIPNDYTNVDS